MKMNRMMVMGVAAMAAAAGFAAQWAPAVSDGFDSHMTFAEEWRTADSARVKSADGRLVFSGKASVRRVGETPNAFRASAKFAVKSGTAGIRCGTAQVVAKAGETKTLTLDCAKGSHHESPGERPWTEVKFCDYASAGNRLGRFDAYRVWLPVEFWDWE